jgi:hypothetical protein
LSQRKSPAVGKPQGNELTGTRTVYHNSTESPLKRDEIQGRAQEAEYARERERAGIKLEDAGRKYERTEAALENQSVDGTLAAIDAQGQRRDNDARSAFHESSKRTGGAKGGGSSARRRGKPKVDRYAAACTRCGTRYPSSVRVCTALCGGDVVPATERKRNRKCSKCGLKRGPEGERGYCRCEPAKRGRKRKAAASRYPRRTLTLSPEVNRKLGEIGNVSGFADRVLREALGLEAA